MNHPLPQKLYGLDHLRALAIVMVFLFHYPILTNDQPGWLTNWVSFGWTGVDLFFVLSGFLIAGQLFSQVKQHQTISTRQFFLKRFFRIIPAYLFTLALYFFIPFFREKEHLPPLWKFLSFTQNIGLDLRANRTFSHCWSLCVEEHFYLVLPLLLLAFLKLKIYPKAYWLLIILFAGGFALRMYCYNHLYLPVSENDDGWVTWYKFIYYPTYARLDGLLTGVGIAAIYQLCPVMWSQFSRYSNGWAIAGLVLLAVAYLLVEDQMSFSASVFGFPLIAIGYGCTVIAAVSPANIMYQWQSAITTFIANLSFAIYLTHKGVIHITRELLSAFHLGENIQLVVCVVTCTAFAWVVNRLIEKPFMQLRRHFL